MTQLDALDLSARSYNALTVLGRYTSVEEVRDASDHELLGVLGFGKISLAEVRKAIRVWSGEPAYNYDPRISEVAQRLRQLAALLEDIARPHSGNGSNHDPS